MKLLIIYNLDQSGTIGRIFRVITNIVMRVKNISSYSDIYIVNTNKPLFKTIFKEHEEEKFDLTI